MKIWLGLITLILSCCTPFAEDPSRRSDQELSKLEKIKDAANRESYAHEMGTINFYVDISDKKLGSMETQIINMYAKASGNQLNATNALVYRSMVMKWAHQNLDTINAGFKVGGELEPRHVFLGVKPKDKKEKLWHFISGKDVAGEAPGRIFHTTENYTHIVNYPASPDTIRKINEFLANSKKSVPYYHWNANELRSLNGKSLSNCLVYAVDALRYADIDVSKIEHIRDPWELAKQLPLKTD